MIIVTGGAGFIGSVLAKTLNLHGYEDIIIVDKFENDNKWKNILGIKFLDVFDKDDFGHMIASNFLSQNHVDTIFHLGACSATTENNFDYLLRNNYEYTKFLCEKAVTNNVKFIYASSAATYGNGENGYSDEESLLDKLRPLNGYGYSKHLFDLWALKNGFLNKIVGLKYFNVYGPNEYHKGDMRSVVNKSFHQIKDTGFARLFKSTSSKYIDGGQLRDFIYVKDAVDMTLFFMKNKLLSGIYNIGTGEANSFNNFVKPIFEALNLKENIEYFDMPENLVGKYQDHTQAETQKIRNAGYNNKITPIKEAVIDYVKNYLNTDNTYFAK